ncbi:MAG TPA: tyrosine-type recombinase/integrase [Streptosporangiales bacterium]
MKGHVYKRGQTWTYMFDGPPDPLTGKRKQVTKGGWPTRKIAWEKCREAIKRAEDGHHITPSKRTVKEFLLDEWLPAVRRSTKPTTWTNWQTYATSYVVPKLGAVQLQKLTAPQIVALYEHLLTAGRIKRDTDSEMYRYWLAQTRLGKDPKPRDIAAGCGVSIHAARAAVRRYRAGHAPRGTSRGLAPKTVRNVHVMLHRALVDAEAWHYIPENVAAKVKPPRVGRRRPSVWSPAELTTFLRHVRKDRFYALYLLAATTGMRRAELCGLRWSAIDLDARHLAIEDTRVVVDGHAEDSDGKTDNAARMLALDKATVQALRQRRTEQDEERPYFQREHRDTDIVFTWEDGRPIHPDVVRQRFERFAAACGLPRIRLHDIRHSYATAALKAGVHPKIVSQRLGHASAAFTLSIYTHAIPGMDREAADTIAMLVVPSD